MHPINTLGSDRSTGRSFSDARAGATSGRVTTPDTEVEFPAPGAGGNAVLAHKTWATGSRVRKLIARRETDTVFARKGVQSQRTL